MQVKIKVFIKIVIIRTERDERILSDHLFFEKRNIRFDKRLYDTAAAKAADKAKAYKTLYCEDIGNAGVILCGACFSRADRKILFDGIVYNISFAYDIYEYFL